MKYAIITTCLLVLFTFFISCKKDHPGVTAPPKPPLTKTQMLTKGSWRLVDRVYKFLTMIEYTNGFDSYPACMKDNLIHYKADKTYQETTEALKCNASEKEVLVSWTWQFIDDSTRIRHQGAGGEYWYSDVLELTDSTLKLRDRNLITIELVSTYKHQ